MNSRKSALAAAAAVCMAVAMVAPASASSYPDKSVDMIVSFPAGGMTDTVSRVLASEMSKSLGQSVVVINRGGAGGTIGTASIARLPHDGYSIGAIADAALTTLPHIQKVPYTLDSFEYICRIYAVPVLMVVRPDSSFNSLADVVKYAKAHPDQLNFATVGPGTLPHLAALDLMKQAHISMTHIPYKGEGQAVIDLLGKHVDVYFGTSAVAAAHHLKQLAVASDTRLKEAPSTPTFTELGYKVTWSIMGGLIAPKGLDPNARTMLGKACADGVNSRHYLSTLKTLEAAPAYLTGAQFKKVMVEEYSKSHVLLKDAVRAK
ncbi:tripartite tricarboxylate transporter substrate binding protein [Candidimonas humi]|uniref:Tripartite tricarboxylate transporter substrate binding protein n=1 Tax=Candidimonas humi TaxID=683355 RepID=A0ABV8NWV3_9BURK|nr:tripartite tricarboxylate transporter substrate binding protein [Candidimonas humi]MBV6304059.1 tripartite tricarboxylate transporter substrate binding protein [Candidimonas humi]